MEYDLNEVPKQREATLAERVELQSKANAKLRRELAALQAKLAESEAQRAVLVAALEHIRGAKWDDIEGQPMIVLGRTPSGLGTSLIAPAEVCRQALANQPPNDLVALVKAAEAWRDAHEHYMAEWSRRTHDGKAEAVHAAVASAIQHEAAIKAALEALLTNQPGFRALIESEGV